MLSFNRHLLCGIYSTSNIKNVTDEDAFIFKVNLAYNNNATENAFTISLSPYGTYSFIVDWGDGRVSNITKWNDQDAVHYYKEPGETNTIKIKGSLTDWKINTNRSSIVEISQWGLQSNNFLTYTNAWESCINAAFNAPDTLTLESVTSLKNAWSNCETLTSLPLLYTPLCTDYSYTWCNCVNLSSLQTHNLYTGVNFTGTWSGCSSLTEVAVLELSNGEILDNTWENCSKVKTINLIAQKVTSLRRTWNGCAELTDLNGLISVQNCTDLTDCFKGCYSLSAVELYGISVSVKFANCSLEREAIVRIFENLMYINTSQEIDITNNPGVVNLTSSDIQIATDRGWTVKFIEF